MDPGRHLHLGPEQEAAGKVEAALLEKFSELLADTARQVADRFAIDIIPTSAFLADVWFFDANMAVAAAGPGNAGARSGRPSRDAPGVAGHPSPRPGLSGQRP